MENFKFTLFSIIIIIVLVLIGVWTFSSLESGSSHVENQKIKELTQENKDLKEKVSDLKNEIIVLESQIKKQNEPEENVKEDVESTTYKYQLMITKIQKIIDANIVMKKGSKGTRVGTIQEFLNLYNKTSNKIDNDFGPSMDTAIRNFQKDQGLGVDGQAGPGTFSKMINWLKKQ